MALPSPLRAALSEVAARAYVPYSDVPVGALALLRDGRYVPGVRVENASFPLTIPAVTAALVGVQALGALGDLVALVLTRPARLDEGTLLAEAVGRAVTPAGAALFVDGTDAASLPPLGDRAALPDLQVDGPLDGIEAARAAARAAIVPASSFPVGCALATREGVVVPGANVEFADWTRGLCAERAALAIALSYGLRPAALYVSCLRAPGGTPCGACRQVIAELAPGKPIWIDQGEAAPRGTTAAALLPDAFGGASLQQGRL